MVLFFFSTPVGVKKIKTSLLGGFPSLEILFHVLPVWCFPFPVWSFSSLIGSLIGLECSVERLSRFPGWFVFPGRCLRKPSLFVFLFEKASDYVRVDFGCTLYFVGQVQSGPFDWELVGLQFSTWGL